MTSKACGAKLKVLTPHAYEVTQLYTQFILGGSLVRVPLMEVRICIVLAAPSFDNGFSNTLCLASVAVRSNISEFRSRMDWISSSEDFYWPLGCCLGKNHLQLESLMVFCFQVPASVAATRSDG